MSTYYTPTTIDDIARVTATDADCLVGVPDLAAETAAVLAADPAAEIYVAHVDLVSDGPTDSVTAALFVNAARVGVASVAHTDWGNAPQGQDAKQVLMVAVEMWNRWREDDGWGEDESAGVWTTSPGVRGVKWSAVRSLIQGFDPAT